MMFFGRPALKRLRVWFQSLRLGLVMVCALGVEARGQVEYDGDGEPTAMEEEIRWLLNRARYSRARENARRGTAYGDVPESGGPLAANAMLMRAARNHSEDMARRNRFQHATVPGSFFYNPTTQPNPWDRMSAEGYDWNMAGENIAAGYESAVEVHTGWWKSTGHRQNFLNRAFREIGNGYYYLGSAPYVEYYSMELGRSGTKRFFTGSLFEDVNGNRAYSRGEGRQGVKVELVTGGVTHGQHDVSAAAGNVVVPLDGIPEEAVVRVVLTNTTGQAVRLSMTRNYESYESWELGPGESRLWGQFERGPADENRGFEHAAKPASDLALSPGSAEHGAEGGGGLSFVVEGNVSWTAEGEAPWLRVTGGGSGTGPGVVSYEVDANDFGDPRMGVIRVTGEDHVTREMQVRQSGVPTELETASAEVNAGPEGLAGATVGVTANVTWRVVEEAHWIEVVTGQGVGNGTGVLRVAPNSGSVERVAEVVVEGGGQQRVVMVKQSAGAVRRVGEEVALDLAEGGGVVRRVSGLPGGWRLDGSTGWVVGRATRSGIFAVTVEVQTEGGGVERRRVTLEVRALPPHAVGTFEMRLARDAGLGEGLGGEVRLVTTAGGAATGTMRLAGRTHAWQGEVRHDTEGQPEVVALVRRGGLPAVTLRVVPRPDQRVEGTAQAEGSGIGTAVRGWRAVWHRGAGGAVPEEIAGRKNVLLELETAWIGDATTPQGTGFAVVTITPAGRVQWSGRLGEGTVLSRTGWLGPAGEAGFWLPAHGGQGSVLAEAMSDANGRLSGLADWVKRGAANARDRVYRAGFGVDLRGPVRLRLTGERWQQPMGGQALIDLLGVPEGAGNLALEFAGLVPEGAGGRVTLSRRNVIEPVEGTTVSVAAGTGRVRGSFLRNGRRTVFEGLLLPGEARAGGFFLAPGVVETGVTEPVDGLWSGRMALRAP